MLPVNRWQHAFSEVFDSGLLQRKRISYRLQQHPDYCSDICRRERVDPFAVANMILIEAERQYYPDNVPAFAAVTGPILSLLLDGTGWAAAFVDREIRKGVTYVKLCEQTGALLKGLGGAIEAVARIESDGKYDEKDDAAIAEFQLKAGLLSERLGALTNELTRRREIRSPTP